MEKESLTRKVFKIGGFGLFGLGIAYGLGQWADAEVLGLEYDVMSNYCSEESISSQYPEICDKELTKSEYVIENNGPGFEFIDYMRN